MAENEQATNYEFSAAENRIFTELTRYMRVLAYSLFLGGALYVIYGCYLAITLSQSISGVAIIVPAIISVACAFLTMFLGLYLNKAAADFVQIVCTEGSDISHLMHGIGTMRKFFMLSALLAWPLVLALLVAVLAGIYWVYAALGNSPLPDL